MSQACTRKLPAGTILAYIPKITEAFKDTVAGAICPECGEVIVTKEELSFIPEIAEGIAVKCSGCGQGYIFRCEPGFNFTFNVDTFRKVAV